MITLRVKEVSLQTKEIQPKLKIPCFSFYFPDILNTRKNIEGWVKVKENMNRSVGRKYFKLNVHFI